MTKTYTPLNNTVTVKIEKETTTESGLLLPAEQVSDLTTGVVMNVGDGCLEINQITLRKGDKVMFEMRAAQCINKDLGVYGVCDTSLACKVEG